MNIGFTGSPVNTTLDDKIINTMECQGVNHIPGIASNETVRGLEEFYLTYSRVHGYVAVAVCLFGVLSNSANILVLTRKNMASSTNTILLWLAVADLLTMLDYLPFAIHFYIMKPVSDTQGTPFSTPEFAWICFLLFHASFSIVCHTVAIWLTIALAIFRYIFICKPTSGTIYCSQTRACLVVVLVCFLTVILCIPNYAVNTYDFNPGVVVLNGIDNGNNVTYKVDSIKIDTDSSFYFPNVKSATRVNEITMLVNSWVQAILIKLVPCFMLVTLTILLIHAMHKAYRRRLKLKSQGRRAESERHGEHNRTTGMLLAIVVLFTLTELPQGILTLMNIFVKCFTFVVYNKLGDLLDIMALCNNSVNFVLYCTMSKQFRTTFAAIFCPQRSWPTDWMKMRLTKSQSSKRSTIELVDTAADNAQGKDNNDLHITNEIVPPIPVTSSNGLSSHTHGYSPNHSHL